MSRAYCMALTALLALVAGDFALRADVVGVGLILFFVGGAAVGLTIVAIQDFAMARGRKHSITR